MANQYTTKPAAILVQYIRSDVEQDENTDKRYQRFTEIMKESGYRRFSQKIVDEKENILDFRWMKGFDAICVYGFSENDEFSMTYWKAMAECAKASGIVLLDMVQNTANLKTSHEPVLHQLYTDQILGLKNDADEDEEDDDDSLEDNLSAISAVTPGITINIFGGNVFVLNSVDDLEDVLDMMDL